MPVSESRADGAEKVLHLGKHRAPVKPIPGGTVAVALATGAMATAGVTTALAAESSANVRSESVELAGSVVGEDSSLTPVIVNVQDQSWSGFSSQMQVANAAKARRAAADLASRQPTVVLPAVGIITSGFGPRWGTFHGGIDIANAANTPIHAIADGVVIDSGPASGYGNWVRIRHNNGAISVYGHMYNIYVSAGEKVRAGQTIAGMGSAGFSTGTHLHFEIWPDGKRKVDPLQWLARFGLHF